VADFVLSPYNIATSLLHDRDRRTLVNSKAGMLLLLCGAGVALAAVSSRRLVDDGYVVEREREIVVQQPGPHRGGGTTTAYPFFEKVNELELVFRKRVLHAGSSIGYHVQREDEIYYVIAGTGVMKMNGDSFRVGPGDAVLTRPGSSHGLRPEGENDLTILIMYRQEARAR
jgi:mannose-6-phosphate isomerase-like protein (cupin superfamily)